MNNDLVRRLEIAPISCLSPEQWIEHRKMLDEAADRIEELEAVLRTIATSTHHGYSPRAHARYVLGMPKDE